MDINEFTFGTESFHKYDVDEKTLLIMILKTLQSIESQLAYTSGTVTMDDIQAALHKVFN